MCNLNNYIYNQDNYSEDGLCDRMSIYGKWFDYMKINDREIRLFLNNRLNDYHDCVVFNEFETASYKARADVVAVNGHIHGYEIKSDYDNLLRLENQIVEYDKNFEMNTIVVGEKHLKKTISIVPEYWGIIEVINNNSKIEFKFSRRAKLNPNVELRDVLAHMTKIELINYMYSVEKYKKKYAYKKYMNNLSKDTLLNDFIFCSKNERKQIMKHMRNYFKKKADV